MNVITSFFSKLLTTSVQITTLYHFFLQNNYFCRKLLSKAASVFGKFGKILRQTSVIMRKAPCYQSTTVLRSFTAELRIFRNAYKIYLELLAVSCKNIFQQLFLLLLLAHQNFKLYLCSTANNQ